MKKWRVPLAFVMTSVFAMPALAESRLGNLSPFETIANDTLALVDKGDLKGAERRITDFESAWDKAEPTLRPKDKDAWGVIDDAADAAIESLRAHPAKARTAQKTVSVLIDTLKHPVAE